ncbi:hypothetical protein Nos7524_3139 [Nostoc sp. PCC 7524]|nr:hypothetical protein Nos7524_3139 [Nostoc sp. PCC 7524]
MDSEEVGERGDEGDEGDEEDEEDEGDLACFSYDGVSLPVGWGMREMR